MGAKASIITFILLLIAIVSLSYYVYSKSNNEDLKNINIKEWVLKIFSKNEINTNESKAVMVEASDEGRSLNIGYDLSQYTAFCAYKDLIIKCIPDSIIAINSKGFEEWSKNIDVDKPLVKTNGTSILVADVDGKMIYVFNGSSLKWEKKIEDKIINADISPQGYVTIVHEANGYKGAVSAFDPHGIEMFSRFIASNFVLSSKMAPSGKDFLINEVDISGTEAISYIEFFNSFEKPTAGIKMDEIMPYVNYMGDGSVLATGTSKIIHIDKAVKEKWEKEYTKIYSSIICEGKYIVIAADNLDKPSTAGFGNAIINIFNQQGEIISEYIVDDEVKNLEAIGDIIAVNSGREVHFINTRGKLIKKSGFKADVLQVHFFSEDEALVVTRNSVLRIKI